MWLDKSKLRLTQPSLAGTGVELGNILPFTFFQTKGVLGRLDSDGDGKLDFEEFQKLIKPKKTERRCSKFD